MSKKQGWKFPPTGGGEEQGYRHAATEIYSGEPYGSLARETVQNSLDAATKDGAVTVEFKLIESRDKGIEVLRELEPTINLCIGELKDKEGESEFKKAKREIEKSEYLCVRDFNTIGLQPANWDALVKKQGTSHKENDTAGGSFGIGKNAIFAVSNLRTVFYWSCYKDEESQKICERFQGKSILVSHGKEERYQGIGYYGYKNNCQFVDTMADIPPFFRDTNSGEPKLGTAVWIAGFDKKEKWRHEIAKNIIANYFLAIHDKDLEVLIAPEKDSKKDNLYLIDTSTLSEIFNVLKDDGGLVDRAKIDWEILTGIKDEIIEEKIDGFGMCELRIRVCEDGDKTVSFFRSGMLITRGQEKLRRWPGVDSFYATFRCCDPKGNKILRSMENPAHNEFHPKRLDSEEKKQFNKLIEWIRTKIKEIAGREIELSKKSNITDLSKYFPDPDYDGGSPDESSDPPLESPQEIYLMPPKKPGRRLYGSEPTEVSGGKNGGVGGNSGKGKGRGGKGGTKRVPGKVHLYPVNNIRLVSKESDKNCYIVYFTPDETGRIRSLRLSIAGDTGQTQIDIEDCSPSLPLEVEKGTHCSVEIKTSEPLPTNSAQIVEFINAI
ncbi:MAG: hypothetical protein GDA50_03535 [Alphaproteobacteria bacterium GM202ARS2]|nr:hypothetical protein [Alphaproteobacteria bacterium GM202ARS2]